VLDGNVFRVLSRIFDKEIPIDSTAGKKEFSMLAQTILPQKNAGDYNQAVMDFGATICKPVPLCQECFFNKRCLAYLTGKQQLLPIKEKKTSIKKRWLNYFIVQCGEQVLIQQRTTKDVWQDLHQFFLVETEKNWKADALLTSFREQSGMTDYSLLYQWKTKQALSHQNICFHFFYLRINRKKKVEGYQWIKLSELEQLAFPRTLKEVIRYLHVRP
jgi:A/G-specific adenine glycosylase